MNAFRQSKYLLFNHRDFFHSVCLKHKFCTILLRVAMSVFRYVFILEAIDVSVCQDGVPYLGYTWKT